MTWAKYIKQFAFIWSRLQWVTFSFTSVHRLVWRNPPGDVFRRDDLKLRGVAARARLPQEMCWKCLSYIVRRSCGKVFKHVFLQSENSGSLLDSPCAPSTPSASDSEWSDRYVSTTGGELQRSSGRVPEEEICQMCWLSKGNSAEHPHKLICPNHTFPSHTDNNNKKAHFPLLMVWCDGFIMAYKLKPPRLLHRKKEK